MRNPPKFELCLGTVLALGVAAPLAIADEATALQPLRAMQIHIDEATGEKMLADDSDAGSQGVTRRAASVQPSALNALSSVMPARSSNTTVAADGTLSATLGTEQMKFLVLTIDGHGERTLSHRPMAETATPESADASQGEEE